jgi:uncharacterized membrane protein SpoIIM required for sporulation
VCHDLALARQRQLDAHVVDRLNGLALRGHQYLYRPVTTSRVVVDFVIRGFPRAVRSEARFVLVAALLFYGSGITLAGLIQWQPELVHSVLDPGTVAEVEAMYDPGSEHHLRPRGADTDAAMFGFYIRNNVGIGFRTFASGVFFGLGSLFFLLFNGIILGAVGGHLIHVGLSGTFTSFVIGHGALELQAIVLAAAGGLRLGWPLLAPGPYSRGDALQLGARSAVKLVLGAAILFFAAAAIEAFWSSSVLVPASIKYAVGGVLWLLMLLYLFSARRPHGS